MMSFVGKRIMPVLHVSGSSLGSVNNREVAVETVEEVLAGGGSSHCLSEPLMEMGAMPGGFSPAPDVVKVVEAAVIILGESEIACRGAGSNQLRRRAESSTRCLSSVVGLIRACVLMSFLI